MPSLYDGAQPVIKRYVGTVEIRTVYVGTQLVRSAQTPPDGTASLDLDFVAQAYKIWSQTP